MTSLFLSYDYKTDEYWRVRFLDVYAGEFNVKIYNPQDFQAQTGEEYITYLVENGILTVEDVVVVLVGPRTYSMRKVDWDISAALTKKGMRPSGLIAMRLPTHDDHGKNTINPRRVPTRLVENIKSGYVKIQDWVESEQEMQSRYYQALKDAREKAAKIKNNRPLMAQDMFR